MHRSFAEHMGLKWPKEVAFIQDGKRVSWAEVKSIRIDRQARHLREVTRWEGSVRHAAFVWVFYQPGLFGFAYMGWWLYLRTLHHDWKFDLRLARQGLSALDIMRRFPCGVLPMEENFEAWKTAFATQNSRPGRFRKQGLLPVWVTCNFEGGWPQVIQPRDSNS